MRKTIILALLTIVATLTTHADIDKGTTGALVTITTSGITRNQIGTANGFAITTPLADGTTREEIISTYSPFKGAAAATVSLDKSKKAQALRISGANDLYDVVKFTIDTPAPHPLSIAAQPLAIGAKAFILHPASAKGNVLTPITIEQATTHSGLTYYTISTTFNKAYVGCPMLNENGEVVGVIQNNASGETAKTFAIGIEFNSALEVGTMSAADPSLAAILMPKLLPAGKDQAASYLYLLTKNSTDSLSYLANLQDYIDAYPAATFGYTERAAYYTTSGQYAKAEADYANALEACDDKADVHHSMSVALYRLNQRTDYQTYKDWTLDRALTEAQQAYATNASPFYLVQQGKCLYGLKRYMEAHDVYAKINQTNFRSSENLYYQSRSLEMAGGDSTKILALLDSAVERFIRPLKGDAAPYLYYRAQQYHKYGYYAQAYFGYKEYEELVGDANLNEKFFYTKEQAGFRANFYPQALADIEKVLLINPNEYIYLIEKALIETRIGNYEDAIYTATQAQKIDPEDPDSYKIIGISQGELGNKAEARKNLQKAIELGDDDAASWLNSIK